MRVSRWFYIKSVKKRERTVDLVPIGPHWLPLALIGPHWPPLAIPKREKKHYKTSGFYDVE